jgi:aryl-alcohol dehydrogenase-like predicted oxidoreductase
MRCASWASGSSPIRRSAGAADRQAPLDRGAVGRRLASTAPRFSEENFSRNLALADRIQGIAKDAGVAPGQLALAWVLAQGVTAIPGTKRRAYGEENVVAAALTLDDATLSQLGKAVPAEEVAGERYVPQGMMTVQE